jgi:3-hydroxybutyrate dehydrogenase
VGAERVSDDLKGRVAIVTGAAGTIGTATCQVLRSYGATVVPVDRMSNDGCLVLDIGTEEGNREMIDFAVREYGQLDILVLNAGLQHVCQIEDFPVEMWDELNNTMVKGPFLAMKFGWSQLTRQPGGRIIVTASPSSLLAEPAKSAYVAAKHGVMGLVKVAAIEGGPHGLTTNAVGPGWVFSEAVKRQLPDLMKVHGIDSEEGVIAKLLSDHPVQRFIEATEIAETIAFLASSRSSGINGELVNVDLGASIAW